MQYRADKWCCTYVSDEFGNTTITGTCDTMLFRLILYTVLLLAQIGSTDELESSSSDNCASYAVWTASPTLRLQCARQALQNAQQADVYNHEDVAVMTYAYGSALINNGDLDQGVSVLKEALSKYESVYGERSLKLVEVLVAIDDARNTYSYIDGGKTYYYRKAVKIATNQIDKDSLVVARTLLEISNGSMGSLVTPAKLINFSSRCAKRALEIFSKELKPDAFEIAHANFRLGKNMMARNQFERALVYFQASLSNSLMSIYAHAYLAEVYDNLNDQEMAAFHKAEFVKMSPDNDGKVIPIRYQKVKFPFLAAREKIYSGYAEVRFTIGEDGVAENPEIITEEPENAGFGDSLLVAVENAIFSPGFIDGKLTKIHDVVWGYDFMLEVVKSP
jgi:tetratricopeptide (TPR) repeat protein